MRQRFRFSFLRRPKLRHLLFSALLLSGIIPLVVSNALLIQQNRQRLESEEQTQLTQAAEAVSREVTDRLGAVSAGLHSLGRSLLVVPAAGSSGAVSAVSAVEVTARLREPWLADYLQDFMARDSGLVALRVLSPEGAGPRLGPADLPADLSRVRDATFEAAREEARIAYGFAELPGAAEPAASMAVPVGLGEGATDLVVEALVRLPLQEAVFRRESADEVGILLIGPEGSVLWSQGVGEETLAAFAASGLAESFTGGLPVALTTEYQAPEAAGGRLLAQVSPVGQTGWAVLVQKPAAVAFAAIDRMVLGAVAASALLVLLALTTAAAVARRVSAPIQRLAETSHEIAEGKFGNRVGEAGLPAELADLAHNFNRMSGHVETYVAQLKEAARLNRELFIGSIRAFAAAIDAKDPYTRGHSERVAALARTIAGELAVPEEARQTLWVAALLHDIGKIGVEDRVLRKLGRLTDEEFAQMKMHTIVGAEIVSSIELLREMIPTIRWHHEAWNGRGYPDGKRADEIPLFARIVAVADTFDAITTNRPYQKAFSLEEAIEIITNLAGSRFDAKVVTAFLRACAKKEIQAPDPGPEPKEVAARLTRLGVGALS